MEGIGFSIFIRQKPQFCKDVSSFPINHQILHNHNQSQQDLGGRFGQIISRISMEKDKRRFSCRTRQEWVYNIRYHETTVMNVGIGKNTQTIMEQSPETDTNIDSHLTYPQGCCSSPGKNGVLSKCCGVIWVAILEKCSLISSSQRARKPCEDGLQA